MLILHLGLPWTGASFLQHEVFSGAEGLRVVRRDQGRREARLCRTLRALAAAGPGTAARSLRLQACLQLRGFAGAGPLLISDETLAVDPCRFWQGTGPTPEEFVERLAGLGAGPLRVVIGVRRQDRWLAAGYAGAARHFPDFAQADFDRRLAEIAAVRGLPGPLGWLDFDWVAQIFARALGAGNVLMLPFERLAAEPGPSLAELGRFLGVAARSSAPPPRGRAPRWPLPDAASLTLDPAREAALMERFAAGNTALGCRIPLGF